MGKKSFLARVDTQKSVNGTVSIRKKDAENFIKSANAFCEKLLLYMLARVPGFHDINKGHRQKRKRHKGFVRSAFS